VQETYGDLLINVPTTFPAREMNGVHIAGFVALDLECSTHPRSPATRLQEMDYLSHWK